MAPPLTDRIPATARDRIALVADPDSFAAWDEDVVSTDPLGFADVRPYAGRLADARVRTGLGESVLTGAAMVSGRPIALVAGEFGFLGGSIGVATGERVARAFERARERRLPLIALPASGGSRMQEGTLALVQMAKLATAATRLRAAGLPYIVCLNDPTTGGVLASWGSLASVTFALSGALLGFAGPRVVELLTGEPLPDGVQRAETLLAGGLLDDVVEPGELRERVARVLAVAGPGAAAAAGPECGPPSHCAPTHRDAWAALLRARDRRRPGAQAVLDAMARDVTELRGDRTGQSDDPGCLAALARLCGRPVVVVAQRRAADGAPPALGPAGYRKARRAFALAAELSLPVVTIVDTPGALLSEAAERGGLAGEIAGCLAELGSLPVPTLALLLGEGGSGGALAFLHADRVICAENASLGVIAPEGASAILYRDLDHAPELAATQGGSSWQLLQDGIVDTIVPEPTPAHEDPDAFLARVRAALEQALTALLADPGATGLAEPGANRLAEPDDPRLARLNATRLAARTTRWRELGAPRN
ncbi:carboxyl transferase domain-containing protein [Conexibacter sp. CPCC 206217]|uniref:carboxyl transferase domain-containing protein n=1 Tax=Conexibacter sp. CPCC 206217 TaxID=3064574 RepID=UPI002728D81C|nr:carboxyl transferase domain-containing protein [Conexibacter sp. CPCC 206217]MDO8210959.1 carboxyl transferase domain-containing protein [Conexibacter sp. CPCC 206217]